MGWLKEAMRSHRKLAAIALGAPLLASPICAKSAPSTRQIPVAPPPMGWSSWNSFGDGISEAIIDQQADALKAFNARLAPSTPNYSRLNIDDGWWPVANGRNPDGSFKIDPNLWTNGKLAAAVQHIHADGLLAGAYGDVGKTGCAGDGGSEGHYQPDMLLFARWGFDYVKVDFCGGAAEGLDPQETYSNVAQALQYAEYETGRSLYFSLCDWGFYAPPGFQDSGQGPWTWAPGVNLVPASIWRTSGDITYDVGPSGSATFSDVLENFHASIHPEAQHTGYHNDPDMMIVGIKGVDIAPSDPVQSQAHMSLWAVEGAPLLIGANMIDVLNTPALAAILSNPDVIAVDQDSRGLQAIQVAAPAPGLEVWARLLSGTGRRAVVLLNATSAPTEITVTANELGLDPAAGFMARDLWSDETYYSKGPKYSASVPAQGAAMVVVTGNDLAGTDFTPVNTAGAMPGRTVKISVPAPGRAPLNEGPTPIDVNYVNSTAKNLYSLLQVNGGGTTVVSLPPTGGDQGTITLVANLHKAISNTLTFWAITGSNPDIRTVSIVAGPVPAFQAAVQADAPGNALTGTATVAACPTCSDGHDVVSIGTQNGSSGTLTINGVTVSKTGLYRILVAYANGNGVDVNADVMVNGAPGSTVNFPLGKDTHTVQIAPMIVLLQAGKNAITFANPTSYGPDISALSAPKLIVAD